MKIFSLLIGSFISVSCFSQQQKASVYFNFNKSGLTNTATKILDNITSLCALKNISLSGNCDSIGTDEYNDSLSVRRILAVKRYFVKKGTAKSNFIREEGFGKRKPASDNLTDDSRSLNRRVDLLYTIDTPSTVDATTENKNSLENKIKNSVKTGNNIRLSNLLFVGNRHILMPGADTVLNELLEVMINYPSLKIELQGHICCDYNIYDGLDVDTHTNNLSVNRAKAVYDYLLWKGISESRLSYKGFGNTKPLVYPEKNEHDQDINRRVEIKIIAR